MTRRTLLVALAGALASRVIPPAVDQLAPHVDRAACEGQPPDAAPDFVTYWLFQLMDAFEYCWRDEARFAARHLKDSIDAGRTRLEWGKTYDLLSEFCQAA